MGAAHFFVKTGLVEHETDLGLGHGALLVACIEKDAQGKGQGQDVGFVKGQEDGGEQRGGGQGLLPEVLEGEGHDVLQGGLALRFELQARELVEAGDLALDDLQGLIVDIDRWEVLSLVAVRIIFIFVFCLFSMDFGEQYTQTPPPQSSL